MADIIDQIVNISIQDAISSVTTTDVNTAAIVGAVGADPAETGATVCTSSASVGANYGTDSALYAMATKFFAQDSHPAQLVCIPAASLAASLAAIQAADNAGLAFYHVCIGDVALADGTLSDVTSQLEAIQDYAAEAKKVAHVQVNRGTSDALAISLAGSLVDYGASRVALYLHSSGLATAAGVSSGEYENVALVALRCAADSARGTFAHKTLSGITPDTVTADAFASLVAARLNVYTKVAGEGRVFYGTTCAADGFIDNVVKDDWVRFNAQSAIYRLLGEANDGAGVTYDDAGIASIAAAVSGVLAKAADTEHQYIMSGYSVDYKSYDYLKTNNASDVQARNLPLVKGRYSRMNSIHTVKNVTLAVTL